MRRNYTRDHTCPYCGLECNYLGIASHRARCREKTDAQQQAHRIKVERRRKVSKKGAHLNA